MALLALACIQEEEKERKKKKKGLTSKTQEIKLGWVGSLQLRKLGAPELLEQKGQSSRILALPLLAFLCATVFPQETYVDVFYSSQALRL